MAAHAEAFDPDGASGLTNPPVPPLPFSLPVSPPIIDPWAVGGPSCIPVSGGIALPRAPVRSRTRRIQVRPVAEPAPPLVGPVVEPSCIPEPPARTIAMAAGPQAFNVLTAGARPNSSVTLRIDNRTTVTITVNAQPAACPEVTPAGATPAAPVPGPVPEQPAETAPPAPLELGGGIFEVPEWAALWAGGRAAQSGGPLGQEFVHTQRTWRQPFAWRDDDDRWRTGGGQRGRSGGGGDQSVVWEPSSLLLLGSGITGLWFLARRRR